MKKLILLVLLFVITLQFSFAQSSKMAPLNKKTLHLVGIFAGASSIFEDGATSFVMNLNYEYRYVKSDFGVGFNAEFMFGNLTEMLFCVPFYFHNVTPLNVKLSFGPGIAVTKRILYFAPSSLYPKEFPKTTLNNDNSTNFFLRIGLGWEQLIYRDNVPMIAITPQIGADLVNENKIYFNYGIYLTWIIK